MTSVRRDCDEDTFSLNDPHAKTTGTDLFPNLLTSRNGGRGVEVGTQYDLLCTCDVVGRKEYGYIAIEFLLQPLD